MCDQPPKPLQFSVRGLLRFVGVLCVVFALIALLGRGIRAAREAAWQQHCTNNLKMIGIALHSYHDIYNRFPPPFSTDANGKPMHSWRIAIGPYISSSRLYDQYDYKQPWNSPKNLALTAQWPWWGHDFTCPSTNQPTGSGFTNYVMVVGQDRVGSGRKEAIIVVEIADSDIHWTEPRDLNFDEMSFTINDKTKPSISSHHPHGAMVVYADGSVQFLDESTDPDELRKLLTENLEDASGRGKRP